MGQINEILILIHTVGWPKPATYQYVCNACIIKHYFRTITTWSNGRTFPLNEACSFEPASNLTPDLLDTYRHPTVDAKQRADGLDALHSGFQRLLHRKANQDHPFVVLMG